jgi:glycosyltransferase involved in cell wall biosynthesis
LKAQTTIILHFTENEPKIFSETLESVINLYNKNHKVIIISPECEIIFSGEEKKFDIRTVNVSKRANLSVQLEKSFANIDTPYILYIDNRSSSVLLKRSALDLFLLSAERNKQFGLIYADYERADDDKIDEIHLLKHHIGRLRDNQDYGFVYFLNRDAIENIDFPVPSIHYNTLYDLILKLSEKYKLIHIANRYWGSLYTVYAQKDMHNVFDYLLSGKDMQMEAEEILSGHLLRIGAYLKPGDFYRNRPVPKKKYPLKASIIIPVYNRPEFIIHAIKSVQRQTIQDIEIIVVVNGGSDDPTIPAVENFMRGGAFFDLKKPEVRLLVTDINNIGFCLNLGAQAAKGEYYIQLDSDDRLKPDAVKKILTVFESDPKIGMVIGSYEIREMKDDGTITAMEDLSVVTHEEWTEENGRNNLLRINGAGAPRAIPIELIKNIGFSMNEEPYARNYGEDYNMVLYISEKYRIGRVWDAIYEVIRHSGGTDHNIDLQTIERNDEAKDFMRQEALKRRIELNKNNR